MNIDSRQGIYLAGLLHDIGKFWQRATKSRKELKSSTLSMSGSICPEKNGYPTHLHALYTHEFIENNRSVFPGDFQYKGKNIQLGNLSARHHKWNLGPLERIIQYADILSSGHDRREEAEDDEDGKSGDFQYKYKKIPLLNPFDRVYGIRHKSEMSYYPFKPLKPDETIFANRDVDLDKDKMQDYLKLWTSFESEVRLLPKEDFSSQMKTLLSLLRKYTWCIPSATNTMPDISLYDHLKTTAAIAVCLHDSEQIEEYGKLPETFDGLKEEEKNRFALLVGDFSGIQKFIYQLTSKGAAKTLKGRSFYLNLMQDVVVNKILSIFDIQDAHVLMASGGSFQILLPNNQEKIKEVKTFVGEVNKELRVDFGEAIYLAIGTGSFAAKNLLTDQRKKDKNYTDVVRDAYAEVEADKTRKFATVIDDDFFAPGPVGGTSADQICHVTGMDLQRDQGKSIGNEMIVSPRVFEQIELGKWLRNTDYILKIKKSDGNWNKNEITPLQAALSKNEHVTYRFLNKKDFDKAAYKDLLTKDYLQEVISVNETDFMKFSEGAEPVAHSFRFYGAAWTPESGELDENTGKPRTVEFTDISDDGVNNLMAVLRLDVDSLSNLFKEGFEAKDGVGNHLASISRFSNMSEKLDLFFSGYIHHLISTVYENANELSSSLIATEFTGKKPNQFILPVYAGGDDVFIICRWDLAPQIAKRVYDDFKQFTNQHDKMSLSGGVSIVHAKYPIHKAATEAEGAESKAKMLSTEDGKPDGKDAFCMFGQAMSWKDFKLATGYVQQIAQWQKEMDSRALLGFLRNLHNEYHEKDHYGKWRWRSAYRLKRMGERYKNVDNLSNLASWLFNGTYNGERPSRLEILPKEQYAEIDREPELVDITGFTVRWVQSLTRNKS